MPKQLQKMREWASGPSMRASLFHSGETELRANVFPELWKLLRHPIRAIREERHAPRTRASLFHYIDDSGAGAPVDWTGLLKDLVTGHRFAVFIPSLWSDPVILAGERAELRMRRMETGVLSLMVHGMIVIMAVFAAFHKPAEDPRPMNELVVFVGSPMQLPSLGDGQEGGGGGGGGKQEKDPASGGRLPDTAPVQLMPPDPGFPRPLLPDDNPNELRPSVQVPIALPSDLSLPIGDITAPLGGPLSSGPGIGGGIGNGRGTGDGSGQGPGGGTGSGGGLGDGPDGGIGNRHGPFTGGSDGLNPPEVIMKPTPYYTEDARKERIEGIVVLQVVIRANGSVDSFKVLQGLGHGLDESAIRTIANQWKFRPATIRGTPVDFPAKIEVTFRLY
jgi:protein TonB